jgi:hypothetical protein
MSTMPSIENPLASNNCDSLYPSAKVIGNDLSPIQPKFVAPNVEFIVDDFEETWLYPENKFDYVHGRTLIGYLAR